MLEVPVYVITGFLESGKTTFIREVLDSPDFADGEKTLVLLCEEGLITVRSQRVLLRGNSIQVRICLT